MQPQLEQMSLRKLSDLHEILLTEAAANISHKVVS